eukprot:8153824-Pyramimonas_sp.AAC.1
MGYLVYELSPTAYVKMMLHVMKHPSSAVNGVLVGPKPATPNGDEPVKAVVVDAVPLFHGMLSLAPMTEIALTQVTIACKNLAGPVPNVARRACAECQCRVRFLSRGEPQFASTLST